MYVLALALARARSRVCMICMAPVGTATSNGMRIQLWRSPTDDFERCRHGASGARALRGAAAARGTGARLPTYSYVCLLAATTIRI